MKFDFKLSTDAPGQHMAILGVAAVFIILSLVETYKGKGPSLQNVRSTYSESGRTLYANPQMSWLEKTLCRGYQRSGFCSYKTLHPFRDVWRQHGIIVPSKAPARKSPIRYRGPINNNWSLGKIKLNEMGDK